MTASSSGTADRLNNRLAWLLGYGSWVACGLIAVGMALPIVHVSARLNADQWVSAGIVVLIALPVIRVATMGLCFLFRRERDFALIAALVLAIIVASTLLGVCAG
jgi:hypothetical protein